MDALVIGAGFGGLGAALTLAEQGARVTVLEALTYPGGCASTFEKKGRRFEAGATLFAGFDEGQLFARWIAEHQMGVSLRRLDPVIHFRTPEGTLDVPADRDALLARLCALPGAPVAGLRAFYATQAHVADVLWRSFDAPNRLPPFGPGGLAAQLGDTPGLLALLPLLGRPLARLLDKHGLLNFRPFTAWLDALCQITVQVGIHEVEAPLALAALDFPFRGARHVDGGVGRLAEAMVAAIRARGGEVRFAERVRSLRREGDWVVETRHGPLRSPRVIANVLPGALATLLGQPLPTLQRLQSRVDDGWGAVMLYLAGPEGPSTPHHVEIVQDIDQPYVEGNHLFVSRGDAGTTTVSTHLAMARLRAAADPGALVAEVQAHMWQGLRRFAPEIVEGTVTHYPGSPRTFARFTRRPEGLVGGVPRRAGLSNYTNVWPSAVAPGLWLVGDSVFPGQSTLATAIGGKKVAEAAIGA